jgi:O-antigen ligase
MTKLLKPYSFLFALFCASLPFTDLAKAIPNILMGLLVLLFGFVVKKEDFKKLYSKMTLLLGLFCLSLFFNIIVSGRWEDSGFLSNILITLLIIILSIPIKNYIIPLKAFVFSSLSLLLISSLNLLSYYLTTTDFDFNSGAHINNILMGERPYLGIIYIMAACICWFLAKQTRNKKQVFLWYFISICFIVFVALIAARTALISFFIILLASSFYFKKLKLAIGFLLGILVFGFLMISLNDNIKSRFFFSERKSSINEKLTYEPRYHIWNCAGDIKHDTYSFLLGKGFRTTQRELSECYKNKKDFVTPDQQQWFIHKNFNTHNQYLEFYLCAGILSSLCFVSMLLFTFFENRTNYFATSLLLLLTLFLVTENLIHRQIGVMLMGVVFYFINFISVQKYNSPE